MRLLADSVIAPVGIAGTARADRSAWEGGRRWCTTERKGLVGTRAITAVGNGVLVWCLYHSTYIDSTVP